MIPLKQQMHDQPRAQRRWSALITTPLNEEVVKQTATNNPSNSEHSDGVGESHDMRENDLIESYDMIEESHDLRKSRESRDSSEKDAELKRQILNNNELDVVRRRTNSLQRCEDQNGTCLVKKNKRRLSLMSVSSYKHINGGASALVTDNMSSNHRMAGSKGK
jgi:hypothetical protein